MTTLADLDDDTWEAKVSRRERKIKASLLKALVNAGSVDCWEHFGEVSVDTLVRSLAQNNISVAALYDGAEEY